MVMNRNELARAIAAVAVLKGRFTLRSGAIASEYFDKYRFEADPLLLRSIAEHLRPLIQPETQLLAGLELGGVPLATALSLASGLPSVFVRKRAKEYGTQRLAEGAEVYGSRLLIVEDVVTSGGHVIESVQALRELGALITDALCVIDREAGAVEALRAKGITLRSLYPKHEIDKIVTGFAACTGD